MSSFEGHIVVERQRAMWNWWATIAARPWAPSLALLGLCLAVYLPGVLRLPAVDRTEIVYAETTRDMVARGDWTDPRYGSVVHQFRPIGTFWAQGAAGWLAGDSLARDITIYRIPSLLAVTLAVLALFWLGRGLVGAETALIASALFAVAPLTVLVSQLAIAEGLSLLPATVAMVALARLYTKPDEGYPMALLFWVALGFGVLINALLVPILVLATLIALYVMDRDLTWLKRLRPLIGIPIALAIGASWLVIRAHQDGTPFAGMDWREFLAALGGAQDMKLRAFPGTFVLALVLGFIPGTVLIGTAFKRFWGSRDQALSRFLLAWVIGYLVYLEALSSKPGTYMVQTMFPALALGVAIVVTSEGGLGKRPPWSLFTTWPTYFAALPLAVFAGVYLFTGEIPGVIPAALIALIAVLFIWSGRLGWEGQLRRWAAVGVAALGLFAITLLGVVMPSIDKIWPAQQLAKAIAACPAKEAALIGFREPSGRFVLGIPPDRQMPEALADSAEAKIPTLTIVEDRWKKRTNWTLQSKSLAPLPPPVGCVSAYNVMRGCPLHFRIYSPNPSEPCTIPAEFACPENTPKTGPEKSGDCD
ncbi:glycosyltransferase family 39 protein [Hyphomicrobium sp.]|uniref:glycosyltransferase family 39 protein n=1 Tax=Hyphomicrobium sp. TaxID=82 RepID=UPI001DBF8992|nr:glycosyltransferase family 39 protein [Hyphomicrobium sp.]MBY0560945.1 glycosyltransferase family 39 protein [Hyphomicrobium sp.]